jgi:hypothetical protein
MKKIIVVGGGKGGVGKSTTTLAVIDTLLNKARMIVVDADDSNPDVYKAISKRTDDAVKCSRISLDNEAGWLELGELIEANPDATIIVNTGARQTDVIIQHGHVLKSVASVTGHKVVLLWPINRQLDSIILLGKTVLTEKGEPKGEQFFDQLYVVLNLFYGAAEKFTRYYNNEKLKGIVTGTIELPELDDITTDRIIEKRLMLDSAYEGHDLSIARKSALHRYRQKVADNFGILL